MCLADEDIPQRGRSRSKVEAGRELEALCSGRSLLFDHSRCYEGWCVSGRGFLARLKGFERGADQQVAAQVTLQ